MRKALTILVAALCLILGSWGIWAQGEDNSNPAPNVQVVTLSGTIDNGTVGLLEKAVQEANLNLADLLIVEINTYGGYIDSAIAIKDAILSAPIPTVTFVNKQALSAGSLIAAVSYTHLPWPQFMFCSFPKNILPRLTICVRLILT